MKKEYRVKKNEDIESILKLKKSVGSKNFVLYIKENHELKHYHYAISVPKKFGDAVYRNQMKRRVRSIIREANIKPQFEFFLIIKAQSNKLTFDEIKKEVLYLFNKQNILEV